MTVPAVSDGFGGVPGVELAKSGLRFTPDLQYDDWTLIGEQLAHHREWSSWAIGDWLAFGEDVYSHDFAQGAEALRKKPDTLLEFMRVARRFPIERRRLGLTWSHHQVLASMRDDAEQDRWLDQAEAEQPAWSVSRLRDVIRDTDAPRRLGDGGSHPDAAYIGLMSQVGRELLDAARPTRPGYAEVPDHVLDRLANALGVSR